jgi:hypothetical protein
MPSPASRGTLSYPALLASFPAVRSGERYGFTTLGDLFSFVEVKTKEVKR